jgi:hypothetical protein
VISIWVPPSWLLLFESALPVDNRAPKQGFRMPFESCGDGILACIHLVLRRVSSPSPRRTGKKYHQKIRRGPRREPRFDGKVHGPELLGARRASTVCVLSLSIPVGPSRLLSRPRWRDAGEFAVAAWGHRMVAFPPYPPSLEELTQSLNHGLYILTKAFAPVEGVIAAGLFLLPRGESKTECLLRATNRPGSPEPRVQVG